MINFLIINKWSLPAKNHSLNYVHWGKGAGTQILADQLTLGGWCGQYHASHHHFPQEAANVLTILSQSMSNQQSSFSFICLFILNLLLITGYIPDKGIPCTVFTGASSTPTFQPETSDFRNWALLYTLFVWDNQCVANSFKYVHAVNWTHDSSSMLSLTNCTFKIITDAHLSPFSHLFQHAGRSIEDILSPWTTVRAPTTTWGGGERRP